MAAEYGRTSGTKTGRSVECIADGDYSRMKSGGITLDLATIAAVSGSDATLTDDTVVPVGSKYLRFGQVLCLITASGKYGPYDPAASDGRQTLTRGACYILNRTWVDSPAVLGMALGTMHPAVFDGGRAWRDRIVQSEAATHSLALGPTFAELCAAFPEVSFVKN